MLHFLQLFLFTVCVYISTVFIYLVLFSDSLKSYCGVEIKSEYDYVIVGAGTAGSVIAHRLATETNYTFIILEAGCQSNFILDIPALGPFLHGSLLDWNFETLPQEQACFAMNYRKCKIIQGKIVGGSSKLNNMLYFRGNVSHYVDWFHGKHSANFIKKQFEFVENNILHLNELQYQSELQDTIIEAAKELGYSELRTDFNLGFMKSKLTQRNGKRWTASDNLLSKHIAANVLVEKVIITENTAKAVSYIFSGESRMVTARKGVIITAGSYNTPKILQLSGIGQVDVLNSLNIPVKKVLPVGKNLQDHIASGLDLVLFNKSVSIKAIDMVNPLIVFQYFLTGKGPYTTPGCEAIGFISTKNESTPDVQFMVLPVGLSSDRGSLLRKNLGVKDSVWYNYFTKIFSKYVVTILPVVLHPRSKGVVFINSTDPRVPPLIDPKYLSDKRDRLTLIDGLKSVMKLVSTKAMKSIDAHINTNHFPGCEDYKIFSDSYFECYIKHFTLTSYHPVGTCSMGLPHLNSSVVNTSFEVLGLKRLYVADASVLPTLPSGNINAAIAMMASVFFDTTIKPKNNVLNNICLGNEYLYEPIFKVCYLSVI